MKNLSLQIYLIFLVMSFLKGCHMLKDKHYLIKLKVEDTQPGLVEKSALVLKERLESVYSDKVSVRTTGDLILLDFSERVKVSEVLLLALSKGELVIRSVYSQEEVLPSIVSNESLLKKLDLLEMRSGGNGTIGYAMKYDTSEVSQAFHSKEFEFLSSKMKFAWGIQDFNGSFPLHALRISKEALLEKRMIKTCEPTTDNYGRGAVSIVLKKEFHLRWFNITQKNIGKVLAIQLDDYVLSAPIVNSAIPGGQLQISANYDMKQVKLICALITSNQLPCKISVFEVDAELKGKKDFKISETQLSKYNNLRAEYIKYAAQMDSILEVLPLDKSQKMSMRKEIKRLRHEDLYTIAEEANLSQGSIELLLTRMEQTMNSFKSNNITGNDEAIESLKTQ